MILDKGGEKNKSQRRSVREKRTSEMTTQRPSSLVVESATSRENFKAGKYCRSTRVVLRAPSAGWPPEEERVGIRTCWLECRGRPPWTEESESVGRDEQVRVVAASSGMRGEKYRDEVGLGRSEGNDRPTRRAGGGHPINRAQLEERW